MPGLKRGEVGRSPLWALHAAQVVHAAGRTAGLVAGSCHHRPFRFTVSPPRLGPLKMRGFLALQESALSLPLHRHIGVPSAQALALLCCDLGTALLLTLCYFPVAVH